MIRVLNIISDTNIGGAGRVLINYLQYADRAQFDTAVALPRGSLLKAPLEELNTTVYEVDGALSMIYDGNRTFVVPQRLLSQEEWVQLTRKLKGLLGDRYFDKTSNSLNK